ncbi:hypothetical protein MHI48_20370 [Paenibacillus sp. FSL H7-0942]|uniref:hypothetical protein n=1 Tax=Paenibacillus TaxID=44249 RepID=UPI00096F5957|nr:hypothetical protein [Paenibacillus amylolyticus]OMF06305.1 hypothetical protein BK129_11525 [Paenibacillus amylolyticus]
MNIGDIEKLADRLPTEVLLSLFRNALKDFENKILDKKVFLLILSELTDRQIMTYELLEDKTRNEIDVLMRKLWNTNSYEDVDIILSIVVNLGLKNCFIKIKESISKEDNIDLIILNEIKETIMEVGDHISNPYYDLERFKSSKSEF